MLGNEIEKTKVDVCFKRKTFWSIESDSIKERFVKVKSVGATPFGDLSIWMVIEADEVEKLKKELANSEKMTMKRYDGCGTLHEEWEVNVESVYNMIECMSENDPYGDLEFRIKWTGKRKK
jgi:hypothetical protein